MPFSGDASSAFVLSSGILVASFSVMYFIDIARGLMPNIVPFHVENGIQLSIFVLHTSGGVSFIS